MKKKLFERLFLFYCLLLLFTAISILFERETRTVSVVVIVDKEDFGSPSSLDAVRNALSFSGVELEKNFKIALKIKFFDAWNFPAGKENLDAETAYDNVRQISKTKNADIVIAYTSKPIYEMIFTEIDGEYAPFPSLCYGSTIVLGNSALVGINEHINLATLHEIYHIFGAEHVVDPEISIMRSPMTSAKDLYIRNFNIVM